MKKDGMRQGKDISKKQWMTKDIVICGLFASLIAVGAFLKIDIPVHPFSMHFTLQWFFVLLAGLLLGARLGGMCVCVYLLIGLSGVPVFAAGGGPTYLIRPTFGFLLGFAFAAYAMGKICEKIHPVTVRKMMIPAVVGLCIYYLTGMVYFYFISNFVIAMPVGWKVVLINCCLVTIFQDFLLCVLAAVVAVRMKKMLREFR